MPRLNNAIIIKGLKALGIQAAEDDKIEWDTIVIQIEIHPGGSDYTGNSYFNENESFLLLKPDQKFTSLFKLVHANMNKNASKPWNKLIFTLKKNGNYSNKMIQDSELQKRIDQFNKDMG